MSTPQRRQPSAVIDRLLQEPHRFEFFQAVRLLERWFVQDEQLGSDAVLSLRLQFRNSLSLAFPPSEIAGFKVIASNAATIAPASTQDGLPTDAASAEGEDQGEDKGEGTAVGPSLPTSPALPARVNSRSVDRIEMTPAFMGLLGAGGALPIFYTELFAQREAQQRDPAARAFMDIFLHRAVVIFYKAWRKHRLAIEFEADRRNRFLPLVLSLAGVGQKTLRNRLHASEGGVSDDTLAYFAGSLQQRPVSAATIQRVLAQYFEVGVQLEQFVGRWFALPKENQTALGRANAILGSGAVASDRVWQRDLRMRLVIGPMRREKFRRFLPGRPGALALREFLTLLTGVTLEYEVRLVLHADDVEPVRFSETEGPLLGWDSFLVGQAGNRDRADAGYDVHAMA